MAKVDWLDEMDCPCLCENCDEWFDLQDGHPSDNPKDKTIYCNKCVKEPWGKLLTPAERTAK